MNKRTTKLLILVLVLIVILCGSAVVINLVNKNEAANTTEASTAEVYSVYSFNLDDLDTLTWTYVDLNGLVQTFARTAEGVWYLEGYEDVELATDQVDLFFSYFTNMTSTKRVDSSLSLADVGLDDPSGTVTLNFKDGTSKVILFGDNTSANAYCYMTPDEGKTVYVVKRACKLILYRYVTDFTTTTEEDELIIKEY